MAERRKDSKKRVLKEGEYQRSNGTYEYRWRSENGKRNNVYAKSLEELREKEAEIQRDRSDGIRSEARNATINDIHEPVVFPVRFGCETDRKSSFPS